MRPPGDDRDGGRPFPGGGDPELCPADDRCIFFTMDPYGIGSPKATARSGRPPSSDTLLKCVITSLQLLASNYVMSRVFPQIRICLLFYFYIIMTSSSITLHFWQKKNQNIILAKLFLIDHRV